MCSEMIQICKPESTLYSSIIFFLNEDMRFRNLHLQDKHGLLVTFKILLNFYIKWNIFGWYSSTSHNPKKITSVTLSVKVFYKHNDKNRHIKIEAQTYTEKTVRHKCKKKTHKSKTKSNTETVFLLANYSWTYNW